LPVSVTRDPIDWEHWTGPILGRPVVKVWLVLFIVAGVAGTYFFAGPDLEVDHTDRVELAEGQHMSWETGIGVDDRIHYEVKVLEGGPVDVFLAYDTAHPNIDGVQGHEHIGVMRATGSAGDCHQWLFIVVDNSDKVGANSTGPAVVRVEYHNSLGKRLTGMTLCCSSGLVVSAVLLAVALLFYPMPRRERRVQGRHGFVPTSQRMETVIKVPGTEQVVTIDGALSFQEVRRATRRALKGPREPDRVDHRADQRRSGGGE
jgi:hypothetical protein